MLTAPLCTALVQPVSLRQHTTIRTQSRSLLPRAQVLPLQRHTAIPPKCLVYRPQRASRLVVKAEGLTNKGRQFNAANVAVKRILGEGSYGAAYEGILRSEAGEERVVLKRVKTRVEGAEQMGQMEHLLNVYAARAAPGAVAEFRGFLEVQPEDASSRLTQGLWLVWDYEGAQTLGSFLRRRDCVRSLAADLGVPEADAVPTVMRQLLESLQALHKAGLVHRDVKPPNIVFSEAQRRFKLIDLGACADLRSGTNYIPDESILDPMYCPPEQYCLPTDSPDLAKEGRLKATMLSPLVWAQHRPDRFDSYSAGLVLMQLSLAKLRNSSALRTFSQQMQTCKHDLDLWRSRHGPAPKESEILDANNGAGWELARTLLRPRLVVVDKRTGSVEFVRGGAQRISVQAALRHPFIRAAEPQRGLGGLFGRIASTLSMDGEDDGTGTSSARRWGSTVVNTLTGSPGGTRSGSGSVTQTALSMAASRVSGSGYVSAGSLKRAQAAAARVGGTTSQGVGGDGSAPKKKVSLGAALISAIMGPRRKPKDLPTPALQTENQAAAAAVRQARSGEGAGGGGGEPKQAPSTLGRAAGIWSRASAKLFSLEARIRDQATATVSQTNVVKTLEARVRAGEATEEDLREESGVLASMTDQLNTMTDEFRTLYRGVLGGITGQKKRETTKPRSKRTRVSASGQVSQDDDSETPKVNAEWAEAAKRDTGGAGNSDVTAAATRAVAAGLRFTGQALGIATGMVASIESQAGAARARARSDADSGSPSPLQMAAGPAAATAAAAAADRAAPSPRRPPVAISRGGSRGGTRPANAGADSRAQARAYMEMMRDLSPPLTGQSRWSATRERIRQDERFKAVPAAQREKLFNTYLQAVQQLEVAAKERAARSRTAFQVAQQREMAPLTAQERAARNHAAFQELLGTPGITANSTWESSRPLLETSPAFAALSEAESRSAFDAAVADKARLAAVSTGGDVQFRQLLAGLDPPISPTSTWAGVKRRCWTDARFDAVSDSRRRELFETYRAMIAEEAAEAEEEAKTKAAQSPPASAAAGGAPEGRPVSAAEERERLAARLAELDAALQMKIDHEDEAAASDAPASPEATS